MTNADALAVELDAIADAQRRDYNPPEHPAAAHVYHQAWMHERARMTARFVAEAIARGARAS